MQLRFIIMITIILNFMGIPNHLQQKPTYTQKSFEVLDTDMLARLFKTLVRSIIEYGNSLWSPYFIFSIKEFWRTPM